MNVHRKPSTRAVTGILVRASLVLVSLLVGCAPIEGAAMRAGLAISAPLIPVVNAHKVTKTSTGLRLTSFVRVAGAGTGISDWVTLEELVVPGDARVRIRAPQAERGSIDALFAGPSGGCGSLMSMLEHRVTAATQLLTQWTNTTNWPSVDVHVVPSGQMAQIMTTSEGDRIGDVTLAMGFPLPSDERCPWLEQYATHVADGVGHEFAHFFNFQRFDNRLDWLTNEFSAALVQSCVRLQVAGRVPDRMYIIPGLEDPSVATIIDLYEKGTLNASLAGQLFADALRAEKFGRRPLLKDGDGEALTAMCQRVLAKPIDVRSAEDVQYVLGDVPSRAAASAAQ
jgi:hypothetical protein